MKTYGFTALWLGVLIMVGGCGPSEETQVVENKPRAVRVQTIASRDLPIVVKSVGRLAPNREVVLSAQVSGILMHYDADVGSKVALGTALATLDMTDYKLALQEAKSNLLAAQVRLTAAENTFERAKRLFPANAITPELYDQSEAAYKSSKAQVAQLKTMVAVAQRRLDKTAIATPFDGYVTQRFVEIGQNVAIGDPIMQVADMETMRVNIYINELDYVHLDKDDPVTVAVEAYSQESIAGRVDKIGIQADPRTNTFEVEILVDNSDFNLKAGLTARVVIQTEVIPAAVMVAQNSVIFRENRKEVFVVGQDNLADVRQVKLGRVEGSLVRILEGLMPGDNLVVAGGQYLKPGDKVVVTP
jgi:membrane fusion protein (multidrug efflux system)